MKKKTWMFALIVSFAVAAQGQFHAADTGVVAGKVVFKGDAPQVSKVEVTKDTEKCGTEQIREDLVVGAGGGLRWAVVSLEGANAASPPDRPSPELDQNGCRFIPHVLVAPPESEVVVKNSDGILHNVHTYSESNPPMNRAQPGFLPEMKIKFGKAEIIRVTCDAHSWMEAWIVVSDNPLTAVTDENGSFEFKGVPPGTYTLRMWHETLGEQTQEVTVEADAGAEIEFQLAMK